jgi:hypothetical protein
LEPPLRPASRTVMSDMSISFSTEFEIRIELGLGVREESLHAVV